MKTGITYRLFFFILSATVLGILFLFLIMWWNIDRGFYQYLTTLDQGRLVRMAGNLEQAYAENESWDFLRDSPAFWIGRLLSVQPEDKPAGAGKNEAPSSKDPNRSRGPLVVLDAERKPMVGFLVPGDEVNFKPIVHQEKTVGYVGLLSPKHFLHPVQVQFLGRQKVALALAAVCVVIIAVLVSLPLARRFVRPIKAMAAATHDIASGRYGTRIPVSSSDELGCLAGDFNNMAAALERTEKERRQWIADISHELRTPVAVLRGEIEALLDGVRTVTPETIRSLHAETIRLSRLLEDLYQLSLSDTGALTYRKEDLDLAKALRMSVESYRAEFIAKDISLGMDIPKELAIRAFADPERIHQLFGNLAENSAKYTDRGGELTVRLRYQGGSATIDFEDSPPGVPEAELERLFDRLYRVEASRNRASGGAGLGLAICKSIAEGHDGTIAAYPSSLGGVIIRVTLPASENPL
jgi:two-component system sensor histidine kinase BaeS